MRHRDLFQSVRKRPVLTGFLSLSAFGLGAAPAHAAIGPDVSYVFNTLLFLIGGFLVMWMAAGFAML